MIAVEMETSVIDHKIEIQSAQLPERADRARVIVLFDEEEAVQPSPKPLGELLAHPLRPKGDGLPMKRDDIYDRSCLR
ncbi:MAG TPA: hypothetical protein VI457_01685 [Methylococcaceae bacterium]|nr:hypothetical protein [Methylococcaceae bacterium]